jgi:hypothetical protein
MIEGAVYAYLKSQAAFNTTIGGADLPRLYPDVAPKSASKPYVTFQEIGGDHVEHTTAAGGLASAMVQFSVFAATSPSRETVVEALRAELLGHRAGVWGTGTNQVTVRSVLAEGAPLHTYIPPTNASEEGVFQSTYTFKVWYAETVPQI